MKQKKPLNLNPFVLIFAVVVVAWLFTFIITPGTLVDGVYTALPKNAFNFNNVFNLFRAVPMGIKDTSNLVILVLVIGGALEIYKSTGAIDSSITKMVHKFGSGSRTFLLIALMVLFSVIGGFHQVGCCQNHRCGKSHSDTIDCRCGDGQCWTHTKHQHKSRIFFDNTIYQSFRWCILFHFWLPPFS